MCLPTAMLKLAHRTEAPHPYSKNTTHKRHLQPIDEEQPSHLPSSRTLSNMSVLAPPPAPTRRFNLLAKSNTRNELDDFLTSEVDVDLDLELSFASSMSLNSPVRDPLELADEEDMSTYTPMDVSPALPLAVPSTAKPIRQPVFIRPHAFTTNARLFGKDMSNNSASSVHSLGKSLDTSGVGKPPQRPALPMEWTSPGHNERALENMPSSPATSDVMDIDNSFDVDSSFNIPMASSAPQDESPLATEPTITSFRDEDNLLSTIPIVPHKTASTFQDFFYDAETPSSDRPAGIASLPHEHDLPQVNESDLSDMNDTPCPPQPKRQNSGELGLSLARRVQQRLLEEAATLESSPAPSSPMARKAERIAKLPPLKPMLGSLGAPLQLGSKDRRMRRPTLSIIGLPGEKPILQARSAYPTTGDDTEPEEEPAPVHPQKRLPAVRRAYSAMLPPPTMESSLDSEDGIFDSEGPDVSSPAQSYARRQRGKAVRKDDFQPLLKTGKLGEDSDLLFAAERETPRSKYLNSGSKIGGFGDNEASGKILPCHRVREDGLMRITSKTLDDLLDGAYDSQLASHRIIDCRFDYEYNGGHILGAININTTAGIEEFFFRDDSSKPIPSISGDPNKKTVLIFHCEFSVKRAPTFAKHLRSKDRALNNHVYPKIHYPEVYVLEGGYSRYYQNSTARCQPCGYVRMDDPRYAQSRREDLGQFRRGKFGRTKSYAYGEGKLVSHLSQYVKRNSAPITNAAPRFANANAARSKRGGLASGLHVLAEDPAVGLQSDDDVDVGDSPCPPPNKGVPFRGKRLGRLVRAETFDGGRLSK
ncbi:uncharacterized protein LAESUDRAFT_504084 [Laetiporus sulphureus 93-53]|uniref:M-phase inducer phosphatase n=1 Tax=Laetiporus sulphureus 93-53 TaxID=1314785 RepID=A0A165FU95_9APHY|nr:uncharacterized protein LAESUDRAFT_504084 [Laetiporus sulphureus 93-53]KZT09418.1 hypothetical protein LAESUDRAFT_504084 [Laetiporus sulphureus 93-53]